jgi:Ca2+-binding RTX toxin-like protein
MPQRTSLDYYKYATLATAAYVRMGGRSLDGATFANEAGSPDQARLPTSLGTSLFNPEDPAAPRWQILSYYGSDAREFSDDESGFAATLFQQDEEKVLAIRGTEPGTDGAVDLFSADLGQIGIFGIAVTQVVATANYLMRLTWKESALAPQVAVRISTSLPPSPSDYYVPVEGIDSSTLYLVFSPAERRERLDGIAEGEVVKLTGHSLGGHVAAMAAKLFPNLFDQDVTVFNSAGYDPTTTDIAALLLGPVVTTATRIHLANELGAAAALLSFTANQKSEDVLRAINGALRGSRDIPLGNPNVISLVSEDVAPGDDLSIVASAATGAYRYGAPINVATEANSHVMEPFMDSLSLHALMYSMGRAATIQDTNAILESASRRVPNSEETLISAMYKLLKGQVINLSESDATGGVFGFFRIGKGSIGARNDYYTRLLELQAEIASKPGLTLSSLVGWSASDLVAATSGANELAYRYALKELNPFVVTGNASLYSPHNAKGELNLYSSPSDTPAGMTQQYLDDRAAFLARKNAAHIADVTTLLDPAFVAGQRLRYTDLPAGLTVTVSDAVLPPNDDTAKRLVFGGRGADAVVGGSFDDRLYGGMGADVLIGGEGNDYLEGGAGMDVYAYGAETNLLFPDTNDGDDEIRDTDGNGTIRYTLLESGSASTSSRILGGAAIQVSATQWRSPDDKVVYDQRGPDLLVAINGDAGGSLLIRDFGFAEAADDGYLGIRLTDPLPQAPASPVRTFYGDKQNWDSNPSTPGEIDPVDDGLGNYVRADGQDGRPDIAQPDRADVFLGSNADEVEQFDTAGGNDFVQADGPDSVLSAEGGSDVVIAGAGSDTVEAGGGSDWVEGGPGDDILGGNAGDDVIWAEASSVDGTSISLAQAITAGNVAAPTAGQGDLLTGDSGSDRLIGASTADLLLGGADVDIIVGGGGDDNIYGDAALVGADHGWAATRSVTAQGSTIVYQLIANGYVLDGTLPGADGGADYIYGGAGSDWIFAGAGLDHQTTERFAQTVNRLKTVATVLFISHQLPRSLSVDEVSLLGADRATQMRVVEEGLE